MVALPYGYLKILRDDMGLVLCVCVYKDLFIFSCAGSLLLSAVFSRCGKQGLLFIVMRGLLVEVASLVAEHRL